jgi:hypothetical protein
MADPKDDKAPEDEELPYDPYSAFDAAQASGAAAMHDQVIQQVSELLAGTDLSEEDKQKILASISCPCCGGAGPSLVFDLNPPKGGGPIF